MENQHFFMVYVEDNESPKYKHATLVGAENEAKRLAELTGKKVFVLTTLKKIYVEKFKIEDARPDIDDLPF